MSIIDNGTPPAGDPGTAGVPTPVVEPPSGDAGGAEVEVPVASDSGEGSEGGQAPELQYLDVDQYADHLVKIKVDGEDRELPFKQVREGLMMQAAFTQRTQELADERRKLQQADALVAALDADPARTLKQLSDIYDLEPESGFGPVERDPQEQKLVQMERQLTAQQEAITRQQIENEVAAIRAEHGEFDVMATARFAQEQGLRLSAAHMVLKAQEAEQAAAQAAQTEQRRQAALAAQVAHGGTATQRGTVAPGQGKKITSIRDAWALAKEQVK